MMAGCSARENQTLVTVFEQNILRGTHSRSSESIRRPDVVAAIGIGRDPCLCRVLCSSGLKGRRHHCKRARTAIANGRELQPHV